MDVRLDGVNWLLDDELDPDRSSQVHHDVAEIDELCQHRFVRDRIDGVVKPRVALEVDHVLERSRRQVIEDEYFVAALEERFGKMTSDEARTTGDQHTHQNQSLRCKSAGAAAGRAWMPVRATTAAAERAAARSSEPMPKRARYAPRSRSSCWRNPSSYRMRRMAGPVESPGAPPALAPASTSGERLLGRPMTSAGTPSTAASIATVELTVTTARLERNSGASGASAGSTTMFGAAAATAAYAFGVSAGWVLIASCTSGIASTASASAGRKRAASWYFVTTTTSSRSSSAPAALLAARISSGVSRPASLTMASRRGLPVTASDSGGKCPAVARWCRAKSSKRRVRAGRGNP